MYFSSLGMNQKPTRSIVLDPDSDKPHGTYAALDSDTKGPTIAAEEHKRYKV